jgi:hypothetical protein
MMLLQLASNSAREFQIRTCLRLAPARAQQGPVQVVWLLYFSALPST